MRIRQRIPAFLALTAFVALAASPAAYARDSAMPWPLSWILPPQEADLTPYYENGKWSQDAQWQNSKWQPRDWAVQRSSTQELIDGFYRARIVHGQTTEDGVPVLEVGPGFYRLGGEDMRRVAAVMDAAYGITQNGQSDGAFMLVDWYTGETVGVYTRRGLQLH